MARNLNLDKDKICNMINFIITLSVSILMVPIQLYIKGKRQASLMYNLQMDNLVCPDQGNFAKVSVARQLSLMNMASLITHNYYNRSAL